MLGWISNTNGDIIIDPHFLVVGIIPYLVISLAYAGVFWYVKCNDEYDEMKGFKEKFRIVWGISTLLLMVFIFVIAITFF